MTTEDTKNLNELLAALHVVQRQGPTYIRPTYINGIAHAIANVRKRLAAGPQPPMPFAIGDRTFDASAVGREQA